MLIGSHVSFNKESQLLGSLNESLSYGANTFMFYTGAPQNTNRYPIDDRITKSAIEKMNKEGIDPNKIIVHAPYIINIANRTDENKYRFSVRFLQEELYRCKKLGVKYLVLHPGSHVGSGIENGIENIINALNEVLSDETDVTILLETMSGKGTEVGSRFEELKSIIDAVTNKKMIGVCIDTCHLSDAGYDIVGFDKLLDEFDKIIGLSYIKCVHVNDSKNEKGAHKDRHDNLGYGSLGFENLLNIIYNPRLEDIPKILETPWIDDRPPYKEEIEMIRSRKYNSNLKGAN